ncbi:unnamed protein product [Didymodactylos carnosus]|uniref:Fe2OG dioxygenase domain-containing protein n=1 Tax=Didymodactylos carnosus TaxID=1234261 RepID=A0A816AF53_9BILA|nr:unnamed protein product [Didymodactylos carnosus]CAF4471700.1 unnamed protein product [Didymodactylos carnosus]
MASFSEDSHNPFSSCQTTYGSGDSYLILDILPKDVADDHFYNLKHEIQWNEMYQKGGKVPREISIQGTIDNNYEPLYRHPADEQPSMVEWTPISKLIKDEIEKRIKQPLNHALIQYYKDGFDFIGEHSDKTLDVLRFSNIVNYSLGSARTMILKSKTHDGRKGKFKLPHNSLFVLGWKTNREWFHSIRQDKRANNIKDDDERAFDGQRISLTLRTVATFRHNVTGKLYGQGAKCKTLAELEQQETVVENDDEKLLYAFSAENKDPNFDWDKWYGNGFDTINFKVLNSISKT